MNNNTETTNSSINLDELDSVISQVVDTLKFHGVEITEFDIRDTGPYFKVKISKKRMYQTIDDTLNFTYWALWTLIYGEYTDDKSDKFSIALDYKEVE